MENRLQIHTGKKVVLARAEPPVRVSPEFLVQSVIVFDLID
jgi:hypothetical protein